MERQLIDAHHPLKIGDTVETVYQGGKKMVVDKLNVTYYKDSVWFDADGFCINKDGNVGKQRGSKSNMVRINQ